MKVKGLISKLSAFDPQQKVLCYCEDEDILPEKHGFRVFEIDSVDRTEAEAMRGKEGLPYFKLGKSENSKAYILIEITTDF